MKRVIVVVCLMMIFLSGCKQEPGPPPHPAVKIDVTPSILTNSFRLPNCKTRVVPPVQFTQWSICDDGGTFLFKFLDSRTNEFGFYFDGQQESETQGDFYFGGKQPSRANARRLYRGSQYEKNLISLIHQWVNTNADTEKSKQIEIRLKAVLDIHKKTENSQLSDAEKTKRYIIEIKKEIEAIEATCVPEKGTSREELESIFGKGNPAPPIASKKPSSGKIPADSPRREYQLCENGLLAVVYDDKWQVENAYYLNPYSKVNAGIESEPPENKILKLENRFEQMKDIQEAYKKKAK